MGNIERGPEAEAYTSFDYIGELTPGEEVQHLCPEDDLRRSRILEAMRDKLIHRPNSLLVAEIAQREYYREHPEAILVD